MEYVIDVAFVLGAVAFFKKQFNLSGWQPVLVAFLAVLGVSFIPELVAAFPQAAPILEKVVRVVQLFLTAPGLFDLAVDLKQRSY